MALTIINGIMLVVFIIVAISVYMMVQSLGELIVRFVEINQDHFKNQKKLIDRSNELVQNLKKLQTIPGALKTSTRKLDSTLSRISVVINDSKRRK